MVGERSFAIYCSNNYLVAHKHKQTLWNFTHSFNRCRAVVCCFPLHSWKCETLENRSLNDDDCSPWKHEKTFLPSCGWTFVCVHVLLVIDTQSFIIFFCQTTEKSSLHFFIYLVRVEFAFVCFCLIWRNNNAAEAKRECEHDSDSGWTWFHWDSNFYKRFRVDWC